MSIGTLGPCSLASALFVDRPTPPRLQPASTEPALEGNRAVAVDRPVRLHLICWPLRTLATLDMKSSARALPYRPHPRGKHGQRENREETKNLGDGATKPARVVTAALIPIDRP